jgi:CDP-glucose 4,6-dehydratase
MGVTRFYRSRRVLVTGLTGFKGIWLAEWLRRLGAEVSGLALPAESGMAAGWAGLAERLPCHHVDVREPDAVARVVAADQPEVIFHLAAQPLVSRGYKEPAATFATNVMGTAHVLDAALATPSVRAVVVVTSDKCYENREWHWGYRESDPMGGHDPYSASKGCAELLVASYRRSFAGRRGLMIASARAGNVIGGGDWAEDRLVPDLIRAILADGTLTLRRPDAIRPWQHVLEPLSGYLVLGERLASAGDRYADGWNFGPADARPLTVREVADRLLAMHGSGRIVEDRRPDAPHEAHYLRLDSAKAASELGWQALLTGDERLRWTLDWYVRWRNDPATVWDTTCEQLAAYEARIEACRMLAERWSPESPGSSEALSPAA